MDLLSKFEAVTVTSDNRISERDKAVCAAHQAAYDAAKNAMEELECAWTDILAQQEKALENAGAPATSYISSSHLNLSRNAIARHIQSLHGTFVSNLVTYFNQTYHVSVSAHDVAGSLLPAEPNGYSRNTEEIERYTEQMRELSLHSDQIVEQILARLDGRSLQEQAIHELKEKCHKAVWNTYNGKAQYLRKKDVVSLTGYACSYRVWVNTGSWELSDTCKAVLRGLAHYEAGGFSFVPQAIAPLLGYSSLEEDRIELTGCNKATQLRLFKNGRVDIRFSDEATAREFTACYLGTKC